MLQATLKSTHIEPGLNALCERFSGNSRAFTVNYEPEAKTLNIVLKNDRMPVFTQAAVDDFVALLSGIDDALAQGAPVCIVAYHSPHKGVFSYGGDMSMLADVVGRPSDQMTRYGASCIDMVWSNWNLGAVHDVVTVALVTGDAFGGGFECALSCDHIIAASDASIGFPEINVGIFPGMGSVPFVARRSGLMAIRRLLSSGKPVSGEEAFALGLVDQLVSSGEDAHGAVHAAFVEWRARALERFSAVVARLRAERRACPVTREDIAFNVTTMLEGIAKADPAFSARMKTIVALQTRRFRK
jgi:DSF synthase